MRDLISLPQDVKVCIISFIARKQDLRSLYRTCKDLYHVTIARAYHSIVIAEHCEMWSLTGLFHPENEGLRHIRHATIRTCGKAVCDGKEVINLYTMLAQLLPRNILITLEYDGTEVIPVRVTNLLHSRQRNLRCLRLSGDLQPDKLRDWRLAGTSDITTIQLVISTHRCKETWRSAFEKLPRLRNLEIQANVDIYLRDGPQGQTKRGPTSADLSLELVRALFGTHTENPSKRLTLQSLQVMGLNLATAAQPLMQAVDHTRLLALGLHRCTNPNAALHALDPKIRIGKLKLRSLVILEHRGLSHTEPSNIFNEILGSFGTLEYLAIHSSGDNLWPDFQQLLPHAATLRSLYLDVPRRVDSTDEEETKNRVLAAENMLSKSHRLEELALRYYVSRINFRSGSTAIDRTELNVLAVLPALRSLRFLEYSDLNLDSDDEGEGDRDAESLRELQCVATETFIELPKLQAIGFKTNGGHPFYHDGGGPFHPPYYTRGRVIDIRGKERVMTLETELEEMVDYEPCSEILSVVIQPSSFLRYGYKP